MHGALTIKASMRTRQSVLVAVVSMDVEPAEAVHAFEFLETVERNLTSTCDKLQEFGSFFLIKGPDCSPEPLDLSR